MAQPGRVVLGAMLTFLSMCSSPIHAVQGSDDHFLPILRSRMYAASPPTVWTAVRELLKDARIGVQKADNKRQALVSRLTSLERVSAGRRHPDLPEDARVQLHVFVSPFARPARVHVGSVINVPQPGGTRVIYHAGIAEAWFFETLERQLDQKGHPIPHDVKRRLRAASELDSEAVSHDCRALMLREPGGSVSDSPTAKMPIVPPRPISITNEQPLYPRPAIEQKAGGRIVVNATILEDGSTIDAKVAQPPADDRQMSAAAIAAVSLWRYEPTRLGGCPVPTLMTVTVVFRME